MSLRSISLDRDLSQLSFLFKCSSYECHNFASSVKCRLVFVKSLRPQNDKQSSKRDGEPFLNGLG